MNFTAYLNQTVTPLSDYTPERKHRPMPEKRKHHVRTGPKKTRAENGADVRAAALTRYRAVMGDDWHTTRSIDRALGRAEGGSVRILRKWMELGLVERRNVGGKYSQGAGFEWRFLEETK